MKTAVGSFSSLPFGTHIVIGTLVRLFLILFGLYVDEISAVAYTDVDYAVFTDAARHIVMGESPYMRHTYRYSPLVALLLTPNILFTQSYGKILFSFMDIVVGVAIRKLVRETKLASGDHNSLGLVAVDRIATNSALSWIYNPVTMVIATRGNADSLTAFLVIVSLLFHQTDIITSATKYFISGVFLGLAIHLRLYPVVFSLPMFLALGDYKISRRTHIASDLFQMIPNRKQVALTSGCIVALVSLTGAFYEAYGYEFLFETYIYHLLRKDMRHNFSAYFYLQYIGAEYEVKYWQQVIPVLILLVFLGVRYGRKRTLNFALLTQVIVIVTYNTVLTAQYFVWIFSLLPLCLYDFKSVNRSGGILFCCWLGVKGLWLYFAFLLEFRGKCTFLYLFFTSGFFFLTNICILATLIKSYAPNSVQKLSAQKKNIDALKIH